MSGFAAPGQYDEAEIERQLQEEYRRRQALAAPQSAAFLTARARPDYSHLNMLGVDASSPYASRHASHHAAAAAASPYARVATNPYTGLVEAQQARAAAYAEPASAALTDMYASHQKQQAIQQAVAANYAVNYGAPPTSTPSASSLDQRYAAAYGLAVAPPTTPSAASAYATQDPSSAYTSKTALDIARMQEAYQRERGNALKRHHGSFRGAPSPRSPPSSKSSKGKATPRAGDAGTPKSTSSTPSESQSQSSPGSSSPKKKETATLGKDKDGKTIVEDRGNTWYVGEVPLGVDDDKYWLSELQVYLRSGFAEAFAATEEDIAAPMHGRNKPIALGQVGMRCMHCKNDNPAERGQQATSYPSLISGIYNSVQQMLRLHLDCCLSMPSDIRQKIEQLKLSCSSRGGRKQYWIDSAKRLGLVDTPDGIHFIRDPLGPLPPLSGPSVNSKEHRKRKAPKAPKKPSPVKPVEEPMDEAKPVPPPVDARPLVMPADEALISDYLFLTLEQMAPCLLTEADRVGCYKTRKVGFPGLACRHCVGQAGCGRYFPASEASLSQTTTSQTIMNHVRNCRRCPIEIRENLEIMKRNRMGPDGKRQDKPKHGGRKVFFHRLWCRIQGIPFDEEKCQAREAKRRRRKGGKKKLRSMSQEGSDMEETDDEDDLDDDGEGLSSDEETATDDEDGEEDSINSLAEVESEVKSKRKPPPGKKIAPLFEGCVRLTKTDDPHWLSEMECFARSDLIEVFSLGKKTELDGYGGRKEPSEGQVGIRCVHCKSLEPSERPNGCINFPDALSSIHTKVGDMIRLHFPSCPALPEDARQTFKSLRGFDAKVASDDSQQYWVDSARDIGLANTPPLGPYAVGAWGISFRRDPLQPSPADELDLEAAGEQAPATSYGKNSLARPDDRGLCTDQVMLLLRQVRPCRFKKSDRRAGPGSRGRDRVMGFPGLCCMHCSGKNTLGRYFPVSAKNLTDSTANSLQAHVASCSRCPEPIKASLAYLGHRSILQKAELSGSWKKSFFQKVWARLHVERAWTSADDDGEGEHADGSSVEEEQHGGAAMLPEDEEEEAGDAASDSEKEELGDHMNALIKAAAIWLTEQDGTVDSTKATTKATKGGRSLPGKRPATVSPSRGGRANASLPTKRRRVHF